jgi:hypothetical protein
MREQRLSWDYYTRQPAISMPHGMAVFKHAHSFTIKPLSNMFLKLRDST